MNLRDFRHHIALCVGIVLVSAVAGGTVAPPALAEPPSTTPTPFTTPNTDGCPQKTRPPTAIDASEVPEPGQLAPTPLPVPSAPVGGTRMAECGAVTAKGTPPLPQDISATAWVVSDLDTGEVLAAKDPHGRYRPASTIKVLLAAVALRTLDMDKVVTGTRADADVEGTRVGIGPNGRYTNRQLMQALIMASGNDAAHAIAAQLGGDAAAVAKMNDLAKSLQALDTHAATPSGLDGPGMSTSAYDLSVLFRDAMTIPLFAELIHTEQVDFPGYPKDPASPDDIDHPGYPIGNDNHLLYEYEGAIGGKTGFTDDARQTFVAAAKRDSRRLAVTLLQAEVLPIRPWEQAARLLDYGFALPHGTNVGELPNAQPTSTTGVALATPPKDTDHHASESHSDADDNGTWIVLTTIGIVFGLILVVGLVIGGHRRFRPRQ